MSKLYTIGHSNHSIERFLDLLKMHEIKAVCDVRSSPYSSHNPQYNRENLLQSLKSIGIAYVFLGLELGPRSEDLSCYLNGKVQYDRLARTETFKRGIERLLVGMKTHRIALMCAEKDPTTCHRMILVCRALRSGPVQIFHILEDGALEGLRDAEIRLARALKVPLLPLFEVEEDQIRRAYDAQAERIAYVRDDGGPEGPEKEEQG